MYRIGSEISEERALCSKVIDKFNSSSARPGLRVFFDTRFDNRLCFES
jgi:hypothetical protein